MVDSNRVHGALLTLRILLQVRVDIPLKKIGFNLVITIDRYLWLMENKFISAGIRLEYVRILSLLLTSFTDLKPKLVDILPRVARALTSVLEKAQAWSSCVDPLITLWLKVQGVLEVRMIRIVKRVLQRTMQQLNTQILSQAGPTLYVPFAFVTCCFRGNGGI